MSACLKSKVKLREDVWQPKDEAKTAMERGELTWQTTAAANILEAKKKHGRLANRKSRSGCITCKARHLKCDEAKPECNRCTSTGRKCQGYPDSSGSRTMSPNSLIGSQLSQSLSLEEADKRTLDFFLSWTAPRLAGSLDKDFWCGHVLQMAECEPFVLDTLLAISTLYEHPQFMVSFRDHQPDPQLPKEDDVRLVQPPHRKLDVNHSNALKLYNRAIRTFKGRLEEGNVTPSLALLSCLLFICVEIIRDDVFAALSLFAKGTELLRQFRRSTIGIEEQGIFSTMNLMFVRLGALAASFGHSSASNELIEPAGTEKPTVFTSMADARTALFDFMADSNAFVRDTNAWKQSLFLNSGQRAEPENSATPGFTRISAFDVASDVKPEIGLRPVQNIGFGAGRVITINSPDAAVDGEVMQLNGDDCATRALEQDLLQNPRCRLLNECEGFADLPHREMAILRSLHQWLEGFHHLLERRKENDSETASYLLMFYHSTYIWLLTRLNTTQTVFDNFTNHFEAILHHAEVYIKAKAVQNPIFSFEVGAIAPLYLTATKCRIPSLRRRAVDLMSQAPRKECMWGANSTAEVASRLITIEEEGLDLPIPDNSGRCPNAAIGDTLLPSEDKRVHSIEILRNWYTHRFDLRATRYLRVDGRLLPVIEDFPI